MQTKIPPSFEAIPAPLLRALKAETYSKGDSDFTATEILTPPRRSAFAADHDITPLETSTYAGFMSVLGEAVHLLCESHIQPDKGEEAEERLYTRIKGVLLGGKFDLYEREIQRITDYKVTAYLQESVKDEHMKQGQINGFLAQRNGMPVRDICICYIQRDWSAAMAARDANYPQTPITPYVFAYNELLAREIIESHLQDHINAREGRPRDCTRDEQWAKEDKWACKKPKNKKARKLHLSEEEAQADLKPGEIIEPRPAEKTYCENYCGYKHVCPQYASERAADIAARNSTETQDPPPSNSSAECLELEVETKETSSPQQPADSYEEHGQD